MNPYRLCAFVAIKKYESITLYPIWPAGNLVGSGNSRSHSFTKSCLNRR